MENKQKSSNEAHSEPLQQCNVVGSAFEMSWNLTAVEKPPLRTKILVNVNNHWYKGTTTGFFIQDEKTGDLICILDVGGWTSPDEITFWSKLPSVSENMLKKAKEIVSKLEFDNDFRNLEFDYAKGDWITQK